MLFQSRDREGFINRQRTNERKCAVKRDRRQQQHTDQQRKADHRGQNSGFHSVVSFFSNAAEAPIAARKFRKGSVEIFIFEIRPQNVVHKDKFRIGRLPNEKI